MKDTQTLWRVGSTLTQWCEKVLTWRRSRKMRRMHKYTNGNTVVEWIKAFLWAACMVVAINQYLLQAYQIPSGSMRTTLLEGDRIFVGKSLYGPELLPGTAKIPGIRTPHRGEVVIFENPTYLSRGIVFELAQRFVYMLTLSLVNIDRDASGRPRAQFLIKRIVGNEGEYIRIERGELYFRPVGTPDWIPERQFMERTNQSYTTQRLIPIESYAQVEEASKLLALQDMGIVLDDAQSETLAALWQQQYIDGLFVESVTSAELFYASPHDRRFANAWQRARLGWYVPVGYMLPIGDNRDNSRDGRYFGVVAKKQVLGKARIRYWPFRRVGTIQ